MEDFRSILVIATRQIGDVLITTPLIHAVRLRWPQARIHVLGFNGTLDLLQGNPDIDELIEVKEGAGWRTSLPLIRRLWRRYDLALITQFSDRAHLYGWIAGRVRSGLVPGAKGGWKRWINRPGDPRPQGVIHVLLEKLSLLSPWGAWRQPPSVQLPPRVALPDRVASRLSPRYVVMQVPSLVHYKQWPVASYAEVARQLARDGMQVVLTGGPSARDRALVQQVAEAVDSPQVLGMAGELSLPQLAVLLADASLYIGPDTSVTHLAAACGIPVVALLGPIDPRLWGPWPKDWPAEQPYRARGPRQQRGHIVLLQGEQACVPCNGEGCDKHPASRSECLETLRPARVLDEARLVLKRGSTAATAGR